MPTQAEVQKAVSELLRRSFRQPAEEGASEIVVSYDAEIIGHDDATLTLEVEAYVDQCPDHDQESAAILAREDWWSEVRTALETRLGLEVIARKMHMHW